MRERGNIITFQEWLTNHNSGGQIMTVAIHKQHCLYFNRAARDIIAGWSGIRIYCQGDDVLIGEGDIHISGGRREMKVYSKVICDMLRNQFPGVDMFQLKSGDTENLFELFPMKT